MKCSDVACSKENVITMTILNILEIFKHMFIG
uniref:Uncharacterized protein n=1 Tax=Rhizophora mucronata TaxID=61149 RepID=A0A2P2NR47_RHIMU